MDKVKKLKELQNALPSDYYDNSEIPNETKMVKESNLELAEEYELIDDAIEIIEKNPGISLADFTRMLCSLNGFPELIIVDDNEIDENDEDYTGE